MTDSTPNLQQHSATTTTTMEPINTSSTRPARTATGISATAGRPPNNTNDTTTDQDDTSKGEIIDWGTLNQILEMDEDEIEREFSTNIILNYFDQVETTCAEMLEKLNDRDLDQLSALGHFLKGSSAALGFSWIQNSCEKIQHFGAHKDETGVNEVNDDDLCLERIRHTLDLVNVEFKTTKEILQNYFSTLTKQ